MAGEVVNPYGQGLSVEDKNLDEMFPKIDPEFDPFGHRVVVQVRRVVSKTSSGIILAKETRETEAYNTQIALLVKAGPLAFKNRTTGEPWPEGVWAEVGDYSKSPDGEVNAGRWTSMMVWSP